MIAINLQKPLSSSSSSHSLDSILFFTSIDSIVFKINNIFFLFLNSSTKKKTLFSFLEFYSCLYVLLLFSFFLFFRCWYYLNAQTNTQIRTCIFEIEPIIVRVHRMSFGIKIKKHHLKTETKNQKRCDWGFAESLSRSLWHIKVENATNSSDSVGIGTQLFRFLLWNYQFTGQSLSFG